MLLELGSERCRRCELWAMIDQHDDGSPLNAEDSVEAAAKGLR